MSTKSSLVVVIIHIFDVHGSPIDFAVNKTNSDNDRIPLNWVYRSTDDRLLTALCSSSLDATIFDPTIWL